MAKLTELSYDFSIFDKIDFEPDKRPVGVKFVFDQSPPDGIEKLDKELALCEMFGEAQKVGGPFYCDKGNENCSGSFPLGWKDMPQWGKSGKIGVRFEIFEEARANQKLYDHFHTFQQGVLQYLAFARIDCINFQPDLLLISAKPGQAEIVLRAMSYSTGELWQPKSTSVLGCSWVYIYPYQTGNVNYITTGMHFGMKAREAYPEGYIILAIPYNWIPTILDNMNKMKLVPFPYKLGKEKWLKQKQEIYDSLARGE